MCSLYKSFLVPIFVASKLRWVTENGQQIMCLVFLNRSFDPSKLLAIVACLVSRLNSTEQYISLESLINFNHTFYKSHNFYQLFNHKFHQTFIKALSNNPLSISVHAFDAGEGTPFRTGINIRNNKDLVQTTKTCKFNSR